VNYHRRNYQNLQRFTNNI